MRISRHGEKRLKERAGLSRKSVERMVPKALVDGVPSYDCIGGLRRYLDSKRMRDDFRLHHKIIVYNYFVFIFDGTTLVTVMHLPHRFRGAYDGLKKKKLNKE